MSDAARPTDLLRQVRTALQNDQPVVAQRALRKLADLAEASGDLAGAGRHLGNLALLQYRMRHANAALTTFKQAVEFARAGGDRVTESGLLGNIGNILREQGRTADARDYLNRALVIAQEIGDTRGRGIWLSNLGLVHDDRGDRDEAVTCHEGAVRIARDLRDQRGLAARLANLAASYQRLDRLADAAHQYREAASVYAALNDRHEQAVNLGRAADIYRQLGAAARPERAAHYYDAALRAYGEALRAVRVLDDRASEAYIRRSMGMVCGRLGRYSVALAHFSAARSGFAALNMAEERTAMDHLITETRRLATG